MLFKILYLLFLFFNLSGSNVYLGNLTLKYWFTIVLLLCIFHIDRAIILDKYFKVYAIFIVSLLFSCLVSDHLDFFTNQFSRFYFVAFVGWRATTLIIRKDPNMKMKIIYMTIGIGLLDTAVTLSQFFMTTSWYEPIERVLNFPIYDDYINSLYKFSKEDAFGRFLPGIFGNPVINGYYLALCTTLSMIFVYKTRKVYMYLFSFIFLIGTFCCQERSALGIALVLLFYMSYKFIKVETATNKFVYLAVLIFAILIVGLRLIETSELYNLRYTTIGTEDTGRSYIYEHTLKYLSNNILCPNIVDATLAVGHAPHNIFINAFVYGGIVSFISIMYILVNQTKTAYKIIKQRLNKRNLIDITVACSWLAFTLNGLVHNRSIVTGELICWVFWAIISNKDTQIEK